MGVHAIFMLCSFVVGISQGEVTLEADKPFLRVSVSNQAVLHCCYKGTQTKTTWMKRNNTALEKLNLRHVTFNNKTSDGIHCGVLTFASVQLDDSGMYQCILNDLTKTTTHGTYLQVYKPMKKTINLSESTKNKILTAEGVLLLLCVMVPSLVILFKSKRLQELEKKKMKREEENIYQGLNLDYCYTYDQIERSQTHGPYQDVGNIMEEREQIQLEKP